LTFMANYTWSRTIDDGGTFRSGYDIPATFSGDGKFHKADSIERTVSTSNQPQHIVITGVWDLPFGKTVFAGSSWERAVFGGFKFSEIFQAFSGSPLPIIAASCGTNPAQGVCMPTYNPAFTSPARIHGKWGQGVTRSNFNATGTSANQFIDLNAFVTTGNFVFGNTSRTAPYNIYGPGNYDLDLSLRRSFALHFTESARFNLQADMYNATNHTKFAVANNSWSNTTTTTFGQVIPDPTATRKGVQLAGRIEF
jgi:hypothetical protein